MFLLPARLPQQQSAPEKLRAVQDRGREAVNASEASIVPSNVIAGVLRGRDASQGHSPGGNREASQHEKLDVRSHFDEFSCKRELTIVLLHSSIYLLDPSYCGFRLRRFVSVLVFWMPIGCVIAEQR